MQLRNIILDNIIDHAFRNTSRIFLQSLRDGGNDPAKDSAKD